MKKRINQQGKGVDRRKEQPEQSAELHAFDRRRGLPVTFLAQLYLVQSPLPYHPCCRGQFLRPPCVHFSGPYRRGVPLQSLPELGGYMSPPLAWLWAGLGPSFLLDVLIFYFFSGQVEDWQFLVPFHLLPIFPQTRGHLEFCLPALSGTLSDSGGRSC